MTRTLWKSITAIALASLMLTAGARAQVETKVPATNPAVGAVREILSLDRGWLFHQGDIPFPVIKGHQLSYNNAKAGAARGAAAPDFDDSGWRTLDLPHDWAVEGPFDPEANLAQGFRPRGSGWYRRYFKLDRADRGKHLEIRLDGISTYATIWVNGVITHRNWCGYTSSYIDITPFAKYGDDVNTIAVRVDAEAQEGWWYEGAGMYRHTWLVKRDPVHIETDGVFANPVRDANGKWSIPVEVTLNSSAKEAAKVEIESVLIDPDGKEIVRAASGPVEVKPFEEPVAKYSIAVADPKLWSVEQPTLYKVRTTVRRDGNSVDELVTTCGFRTIRFDPDKGFFLNDQHVKLMGTCNHQDHAGVGVAMPDSLWDFRVRRLKEMGSNAYRCAHNPPAAEFLDACDRQGMLVMDENRNFNTSPEYVRQLEWLVRRDRNRPSVILWSVFNEEPSQGSEQGFEMVRRLSAVVKSLDATRPVTAAQSGGMMASINASLAADVGGFNYQHRDYDRYHAANPTRPITSSEDTSAVMTRGEYVTDKKDLFILDSYDDQWQSWGLSHRRAWRAIVERPFLAGGFVWTGFDYRGEPQPLEWPATGSSFGIMDLCGFPKVAYYIHQAHWIKDKPILHLAPHWNWAGSEGKPIKVMVITNAEKVTLLLNGQSLGEKSVDPIDMLMWDVPYAPGRLEAVATKGGKEVARFAVQTTGAPAALRLTPDRPTLAGDGVDAQPITVEAIDAEGRVVPNAKLPVKFEIVGAGSNTTGSASTNSSATESSTTAPSSNRAPGSIIGLGNGDPIGHDPEKGNATRVFNGLAQVIVQSTPGASGKLTLLATADGLKAGEVTIDVLDVPRRPEVAPTKPTLVVSNWRMSPASTDRPDPNQQLSRSDMNSWSPVQAGRLSKLADGKYVIFRSQFTPRAAVKKAGGSLILRDLAGKAEVWVDGQRLAEKPDPAKATFVVKIPPGDAPHVVNILIEAAPGDPIGLGGTVTVE